MNSIRVTQMWLLSALDHPHRVFLAALVCKIAIAFAAIPLAANGLGMNYGLGFADDYDLLAVSLSNGLGFRFWPDTAPTMMREPGYPALLASIFLFTGKNLAAARLVNFFASALTAALVYMAASKALSCKRTGTAAGLVYLLHPGVFVTELRGGFEAVFMLLLVAYAYSLQSALRNPQDWQRFALAGALLGLTLWVRGTVIVFPLLLGSILLLFPSVRSRFRQVYSGLALSMFIAAILISPWAIRNYSTAGTASPLSSVGGTAAHAGQYMCIHRRESASNQELDYLASRERAALAKQMGINFKDGGYYIYFFDTGDELRFNRLMMETVKKRYLNDPKLMLICPIQNTWKFWISGKNDTATMINVAVQGVFLALVISGIYALFRAGGMEATIVFLCLAICIYLTHIPILAQARYSITLVPLLAIFAAVGLGRFGLRSPGREPGVST